MCNNLEGSTTELPRLITITGPTGVGKTGLGIHLGQALAAEVVNADARYLYRGFDIGVAKPTIAEREGVPHHLIDHLEPSETMSVAVYQHAAYDQIADIHRRGKLPLLVGGSPQYVNAVVEGWRIPEVPPNQDFRATCERELDEMGVEYLSARLREVDLESAERCGPNPRRIIRALEVFHETGLPMSELQRKGPRPYQTLELLLDLPRPELYAAIDRRVDRNIDKGLVEEVRGLLAAGVDPDSPAFSSIGYRQLLPYLHGEQKLDQAIDQIKHDSHRYVRHQQTWFRKNPNLVTLDVRETDWRETGAALVRSFLDKKPSCG